MYLPSKCSTISDIYAATIPNIVKRLQNRCVNCKIAASRTNLLKPFLVRVSVHYCKKNEPR